MSSTEEARLIRSAVRCRYSHGYLGLIFFFSRRRRHTRFDCDWISDVCSSDLPSRTQAVLPPPLLDIRMPAILTTRRGSLNGGHPDIQQSSWQARMRSRRSAIGRKFSRRRGRLHEPLGSSWSRRICSGVLDYSHPGHGDYAGEGIPGTCKHWVAGASTQLEK